MDINEGMMDEQQKKRIAITKEAMDEAYERCLRRERDRERKHRESKQGSFQASMVSVNALLDYGDEDKLRILATGRTLGSVITDPDREDKVEVEKRKLDNACRHLCHAGKQNLVRVLRLIVKNRDNREESICELMRDIMKQQRKGTSGTATCSACTSVSGPSKKRPKSGAPEKS